MKFFNILDTVDSTNNYAMAKLHAGLAKHGMAWFTGHQYAGKGQRGKQWKSNPRENILMSIVLEPHRIFFNQPFLFNAFISNACYAFLSNYIKEELKIKWPNDLYYRDRKTGGLLIENIYHGSTWKWAVAGIGININQVDFPDDIKNAVSLKQITGENYDVIKLGKELYETIMNTFSIIESTSLPAILETYNNSLYMVNQKVKFRNQNIVFEAIVNGVNNYGQLKATDGMERVFEFGEVEWVI